MTPQNLEKLRKKVASAAGSAYSEKNYVTPIDVLAGIGWLQPSHIEDWRKGRIPYLESAINAPLNRISVAMELFRSWAASAKLNPRKTEYLRRSRGGKIPLGFSKSGDPAIEEAYCTHYVSPKLTAEKVTRQAAKESKEKDLVVFSVLKDAKCDECHADIRSGEFLYKEGDAALCLSCADFEHLEFLPSGDAALSRRSKKYSRLWAVVIRFSRTRKRYERLGLLVEQQAIEKAENECLSDADQREKNRIQSAIYREHDDIKLKDNMIKVLGERFPAMPMDEIERVAGHTSKRGSGRIGRSAAGKGLDGKALDLAVIAHIRHVHTEYDELLSKGVDRKEARSRVFMQVEDKLCQFRGK